MSEGRPPHAVILRAPTRFNARVVAAALARRASLPAETFLPVVRRAWGIVAEPSGAEDAEALAADLAAAGQPAVAVPVSLIEEVPPAVSVTKADLSGDGFDIVSGRGNAEHSRLPWSHLKVLSAGAVIESGLKTVTGLPLLGGKGKTRQVSVERRTPFIEMIFSAPSRRVRILAEGFDYGALGAQMTYSAELNFRALTAALAARAAGTLLGHGARAVLAKAPSGELAYESFADVEREERWLTTLAALGAAQA